MPVIDIWKGCSCSLKKKKKKENLLLSPLDLNKIILKVELLEVHNPKIHVNTRQVW